MNKVVFCLMGPTASGKSDLALALAAKYPIELVSVDSAMVYIGMDIGTAKPPREILELYPHHLINKCHPIESYSAARFCDDAILCIEDIISRGSIPLLVGGTMFYFRALQQGLDSIPAANMTIRAKLIREAEEEGWEALYTRLEQVDAQAAKRIHPHDPQRLQRALEVYELTRKSLTAHFEQPKPRPNYQFVNLAIVPTDRAALHKNIALRFKTMLDNGFLDEVKQLIESKELHRDLPSMKAVGYRQAWLYISGEISFQEMQEQAIAATRQLAKRQLTWLRKEWNQFYSFDVKNKSSLISQLSDKIDYYITSQLR